MNNILSEDTKGNLNYLIIEHLKQELSNLDSFEIDSLINKFGKKVDLDLNTIECSYLDKKQIFSRLNKDLSLLGMFDVKCTKNETFVHHAVDDINERELKEEEKPAYSLFSSVSLGNLRQVNRNAARAQIWNSFKFMKSLLGHINVQEDVLINPVPIYCIGFCNNNEIIYSGDNNGLIKLWSAKTGCMVDYLQIGISSINDIITMEKLLIGCDDAGNIILWNVEDFSHSSLRVDEPIKQLSLFHYNDLNNNKQRVLVAAVLFGDNNDLLIDSFISKIYLDNDILNKYDLKKQKQTFEINSINTSKNGLLACGYKNGFIGIWDINKMLKTVIDEGKFLNKFFENLLFLESVHTSMVHIIEFNKEGTKLFTSSVDGNVLVWHVNTDVIESYRNLSVLPDKDDSSYTFPIYLDGKVTEDLHQRIKCSVNSTVWTCNGNYVLCHISSQQRRKANVLVDPEHKSGSTLFVYSVNQKEVIRKYNADNGFSFHEECYILEAHPVAENIILTALNTSEVILLDFFKNEILMKHKEENIFFTNITHNMIPCEGKFSSRGDYFMLSTYLGSISVYSIYTNDAYSATFTNQFYDREFNKNGSASLNQLPMFVNMYGMPQVVDQPYSKFKLNSIVNQIKEIERFYSKTQIERILKPNLDFVNNELFFEERINEVAKEETKLKAQAQDNLNYMIEENNNDSEISFQDVDESDSSEYIEEDVIADQDMEIDDEMVNQFVDYEDDEDQDEEEVVRVNRRRKRIVDSDDEDEGDEIESLADFRRTRNSTRSRRRSGLRRSGGFNNVNSGNSRRSNRTRNGLSRVRTRLNFNRRRDNFNEENERNNRHRLRLRRGFNNNVDDDEEFQEQVRITDYNQDITEEELKKFIEDCKEISSTCGFCGMYSEGDLLGPFNKQSNAFIINIENIDDTDNQEKVYYHIDCLLRNNNISDPNVINLPQYIKDIHEFNKPCTRCEATYATKKCSNQHCSKWYHGYICAKFSLVPQIDICYDCFITKQQISTNSNRPIIPLKNYKPENISRDLFSISELKQSIFYPQIDSEFYFVIHSYESYLKENFMYVLNEFDSTNLNSNIIFWNQRQNNKISPFLCKIVKIEFCFPNEKTVRLLKKYNREEKIVIKLELQSQEITNFQIIFIENGQPDFLIYKDVYEHGIFRKKEILENPSNLLSISLSEGNFDATFIKYEPKENIGIYKTSDFESLEIHYIDSNDPQTNFISFWEIFDQNFKSPNFSNILDEINKNISTKRKFQPFLEKVISSDDFASDYYKIVEIPMFVNLITERIENKFYLNKDSILFDFYLIAENCKKYNGPEHKLTLSAFELIKTAEDIIRNASEADMNDNDGINNSSNANNASQNNNFDNSNNFPASPNGNKHQHKGNRMLKDIETNFADIKTDTTVIMLKRKRERNPHPHYTDDTDSHQQFTPNGSSKPKENQNPLSSTLRRTRNSSRY